MHLRAFSNVWELQANNRVLRQATLQAPLLLLFSDLIVLATQLEPEKGEKVPCIYSTIYYLLDTMHDARFS